MRRPWPCFLALAVVAVAGCVQDHGNPDTATNETARVPSGDSEVLVAEQKDPGLTSFQGDVACKFGGPASIGRLEVPIVNFSELRFEVASSTTTSGLEAGYRVDSKDWHWLPPVRGESKNFTVPIDSALFEDEGARWEFGYRQSTPLDDSNCYTGAGLGPWSVSVFAS